MLVVTLTAAVVVAGCAAPEQRLLEDFFGASRMRDTTALQSVATVIFEPHIQGIVRTFDIVDVSGERSDAQAAVKDVTIRASVALPDGTTADRTLVVTLRRQGPEAAARWMVAAVTDAAASPTAQPK